LIYGAATIGFRHGEPFVHSHCFWYDQMGTKLGGHIWPETIVGDPGLWAIVHIFDGIQLISADDPETLMPVFTPYQETRNTMLAEAVEYPLTETVVSRVLPNVDIAEAIVTTCREAGFESATVRGGIGSLVGGTFKNRLSGEKFTVD